MSEDIKPYIFQPLSSPNLKSRIRIGCKQMACESIEYLIFEGETGKGSKFIIELSRC